MGLFLSGGMEVEGREGMEGDGRKRKEWKERVRGKWKGWEGRG